MCVGSARAPSVGVCPLVFRVADASPLGVRFAVCGSNRPANVDFRGEAVWFQACWMVVVVSFWLCGFAFVRVIAASGEPHLFVSVSL